MISYVVGVALLVGGAYWGHKLTESRNQPTRLRLAAVAAMLVVAGAMLG